MRKKDYLIVYGEKIPQALSMIKDTVLADVVSYTGVPAKVIVDACIEFGYDEYLTDEEKNRLNPEAFYDELIPPSESPTETRDERLARIRDAITNYQTNCKHDRIVHRCSRCMKVLGSELTFLKYSEAEEAMNKTYDDLWCDTEVEYNEFLDEVRRRFMYNLHATNTTETKV